VSRTLSSMVEQMPPATAKAYSLVAGFVAVFVAGRLALAANTYALHWWTDLFWVAASLLAALKCFAVARHVSSAARTAWWMFGAGCFAWCMGMLLWSYMELALGEVTPFPWWSDLGFLLFAPLVSTGLFFYRSERAGMSLTLMEISQLGAFICWIVLLHILVFHEPLATLGLPPLYRLTALAYPALYMALLAQVVVSLTSSLRGAPRRALVLLAAGIAVHAVANSAYAYSLLGHAYEVGGYLDISWLLGFGLIYAAAHTYLDGAAADGGAAGDELPRVLKVGVLVPVSAMLITLVVLVVIQSALPAAVLLMALLAVREWASDGVRRQLDAAVRRSEQRLGQLTRLAPAVIFRTNAEGSCVYTSERWSTLTGRPSDEALGRGWVESVHPADRGALVRTWAEAIAAQQSFSSEFRFCHQAGGITWVLAQVEPERNAAGSVAAFVGSITDITDRRIAEEELRESESRFHHFFSMSPMVLLITRMDDGRIVDVNTAFERVSGWSRDEVVGRTVLDIGLWPDPERRAALVERAKREGQLRNFELRLRNRDGELRDVLASLDVVRLAGEDCFIVAAADISDRKLAETEMLKLSSALAQSADSVMITNAKGVIEYVNPAFEAMTGYGFSDVRGHKPSILKSGRQGQEFYRRLWQQVLAGDTFSEVFVNKRRDGTLFYEEQTITPIRDKEGTVTHFVATGRDISERIETEERLRRMAHHDSLTGLPNRTLFLDRLKQGMARARWHERSVAVLFMDLDNFKTINDTLGHEAGDRLLCELAERLIRRLRERDTVARFGGDEFAILLDDLAHGADVGALAQKMLEALDEPFTIEGATLHVTASIGISLFPGDGEDSSTLLKNADIAMYRAKDTARNSYQFYSAEMTARAFERLTMESSLRQALAEQQFRLHYQPQVDVRSGAIVGAEALIRWQHPELGLVAPASFVPLLEETGLIVPVGEWVLRAACEQLAIWHQRGWTDLRVSVNLSGRQFDSPDLAGFIGRLLKEMSLPPASLELEITESTFMRHGAATESLLEALEALGVRLAVDDFGTGYSSLSYLRRLSIDTLKVDRSFVLDIPADDDDVAITHAIVSLGRSLRLDLVAEGVETESQRAFLSSLGCFVMQGYLYSRPLPAKEFETFVEKGIGNRE
jgi:diguanylate cyclase (GGDEF)-like protein/PAS domain S-box-containing protein